MITVLTRPPSGWPGEGRRSRSQPPDATRRSGFQQPGATRPSAGGAGGPVHRSCRQPELRRRLQRSSPGGLLVDRRPSLGRRPRSAGGQQPGRGGRPVHWCSARDTRAPAHRPRALRARKEVDRAIQPALDPLEPGIRLLEKLSAVATGYRLQIRHLSVLGRAKRLYNQAIQAVGEFRALEPGPRDHPLACATRTWSRLQPCRSLDSVILLSRSYRGAMNEHDPIFESLTAYAAFAGLAFFSSHAFKRLAPSSRCCGEAARVVGLQKIRARQSSCGEPLVDGSCALAAGLAAAAGPPALLMAFFNSLIRPPGPESEPEVHIMSELKVQARECDSEPMVQTEDLRAGFAERLKKAMADKGLPEWGQALAWQKSLE